LMFTRPFPLPFCPRLQLPCYVMPISGRYDVGGLQSYIDCDADFRKNATTLTTMPPRVAQMSIPHALVAFFALASALRLLQGPHS
jgi:hypothetical protein